MSRYARFNVVGVAGFVVQCVVLASLVHGLEMWYVAAGVIAVEAAILHNFFWHARWTWRDRRRAGSVWRRLLRFHAANGLSSLAAHTIVMPLLVEAAGLAPVAASVLLVLSLSIVNFRLGDRVVFAGAPRTPRRDPFEATAGQGSSGPRVARRVMQLPRASHEPSPGAEAMSMAAGTAMAGPPAVVGGTRAQRSGRSRRWISFRSTRCISMAPAFSHPSPTGSCSRPPLQH